MKQKKSPVAIKNVNKPDAYAVNQQDGNIKACGTRISRGIFA